jgi:hypothetical protein
MAEKSSTTTILRRQLQWMKAMEICIKTFRCDNAIEQMAPLKFEGHVLGKWSFG